MEWTGWVWIRITETRLDWNGLEYGLDWIGLDSTCMSWNNGTGLEWIGLGCNGLEWVWMGWAGLDWHGIDRIEFELTGLEWN